MNGNGTLVLWRKVSALNHTAISPAPSTAPFFKGVLRFVCCTCSVCCALCVAHALCVALYFTKVGTLTGGIRPWGSALGSSFATPSVNQTFQLHRSDSPSHQPFLTLRKTKQNKQNPEPHVFFRTQTHTLEAEKSAAPTAATSWRRHRGPRVGVGKPGLEFQRQYPPHTHSNSYCGFLGDVGGRAETRWPSGVDHQSHSLPPSLSPMLGRGLFRMSLPWWQLETLQKILLVVWDGPLHSTFHSRALGLHLWFSPWTTGIRSLALGNQAIAQSVCFWINTVAEQGLGGRGWTCRLSLVQPKLHSPCRGANWSQLTRQECERWSFRGEGGWMAAGTVGKPSQVKNPRPDPVLFKLHTLHCPSRRRE